MDNLLLSGWWLTYPSEKYEFVYWNDDIPNWMEKSHVPVTTNQSLYVYCDIVQYIYNDMKHIYTIYKYCDM